MDHYDSDEVDEDGEKTTMFGNVKSLAYHQAGEEDPYLVLPEEEDDDEEREELQILATDNLLLAAKVEDEVAQLEVYVYEDDADNLYVHHDIMLPAIPLCLEWLDVPVGDSARDACAKANFVAVGTFEPDIEVWDLDVVDRMYPNAILGQGGEEAANGQDDSKKKKKKKKKTKKVNDEFHVDAVLALAANRQHRNLLASSSADKTIKLWDLNSAKCAKSYSHHTDKVCALDWHPKESTVLLSGSYDKTVVAADMRAPEATVPRWRVESDVETARWDPHDPNFFYITTEQGMVYFHDVRTASTSANVSKPVWTLQAHDSNVSSFDVNPVIPGFLATGSMDKQVKLWNVQPSGPSMVVSRNLGVGKVFSTQFAPDQEVGFRLAVAGSKGSVQVWDTSTNAGVRRAFANHVSLPERDGKERLVGVGADSSESEDGEDDAEGGIGGNGGWESMDKD
jgi:periodic tryptophan protein 1